MMRKTHSKLLKAVKQFKRGFLLFDVMNVVIFGTLTSNHDTYFLSAWPLFIPESIVILSIICFRDFSLKWSSHLDQSYIYRCMFNGQCGRM